MIKSIFSLIGRATPLLAAVAIFSSAIQSQAADGESPFPGSTFDLGVVVSDLEKSRQFYTEAIGLKKVSSFSVPADWTTKVGLAKNKPLDIHVFALQEGEPSSKLKLMQVQGVKPKKADNQFVHSQLGYSYITIAVKDIQAALKRLDKAGVKTASNGAVPLPEGFPKGISLILVADPDGNLIELVGPDSSSR